MTAHAKLYAAAQALNLQLHCNALAAAEDAVIAMGDAGACVLEHVCHELAHAFLFGLMWEPPLSDAVSDHFRELYRRDRAAGPKNEVQTFAVEMGVFDVLGVEYHTCDMMDGTLTQVSGEGWTRRDIEHEWREFELTDMFGQAVDAIVTKLQETAAAL